jgi:plastocyanin
MKKNILFIISLLLINYTAFCTVFTVTSPGNTFSPASLTITSGDTVVFSIASSHNVVEVSQTTYNSNGTTPLSGGFSLAFGGGTLFPAALTVGTHYYVCTPHASVGMKAIIIVQSCSLPAQPTAINGSTTVCSATSNTYSVAAVSGATSYTWTLPAGWIGSSTTTSINAIANSNGGNISVKANNNCGSSSNQILAVTTNTIDTSVSRSGATLTANAAAASYQWINCSNNAAISGQTNQSFTPSSSGSYAVIVTKNNCTDTSYCYSVNITGVVENTTTAVISIYPNPVKGKLIIENDKYENSKIEFYNLVGERCFQSVLNSYKTEIDLSMLPKGIYFVKINSTNFNYTKRIVVQ